MVEEHLSWTGLGEKLGNCGDDGRSASIGSGGSSGNGSCDSAWLGHLAALPLPNFVSRSQTPQRTRLVIFHPQSSSALAFGSGKPSDFFASSVFGLDRVSPLLHRRLQPFKSWTTQIHVELGSFAAVGIKHGYRILIQWGHKLYKNYR